MAIRARRILVIGTSCSGKTSLARAIARKLNLAHIELDALHWGPDWTPREDFLDRVRTAIAADEWVTDGNYSVARPLLWGRADLIVWLDYPMGVVVQRALRRTVARSWRRTELWSGNRESFRLSFLSRDSILLWVLSTWRKNRQRYRAQFRPGGPFAHKRVCRLESQEQTDAFLASLT